MYTQRLRQRIQLHRLASGLAGLSFGIILSVVSNWLTDDYARLLPWVFALAVIFGLVSAAIFFKQPSAIRVSFKPPVVIRRPEEAPAIARRGFVCFVPILRPHPLSAARRLTPAQLQTAVKQLDFQRLPPEESNLQTLITAIASHASRLEYCWLLTTAGEQQAGSAPFAPFLAEYLRREKGLGRCKFLYGSSYVISLDDDALILDRSYRQMQAILAQTERLGLQSHEIIADITSGTRSMILGLILACLHGDQDVEFIGAHYDEAGNPTGNLFPIIFSFEPRLELAR